MQRNLQVRFRTTSFIRSYLTERGFIEIETPILTNSTPEGSRDYLVPSRTQPGRFYALPQSPQQYKQLLMVAGFERYFQIARCARDEDLRADRQPDFTQLDLEMSFATEEDILSLMEGLFTSLAGEVRPDLRVVSPFPRITYDESMRRFGTDKPDLRFAMELIDITDLAASSEFAVFRNAAGSGGSVEGICVPGGAEFSRKEIDTMTTFVQGYGAKGLVSIALLGDGDNADVLYGQLAPFAGGHAFGQGDGSLGAIDRYLGLLSAAANRLDDAAGHLQAAIDLNDRMGARPWTAHSQHDLAVVLRRRSGPGDLDRSGQLDRAALATATTLGMIALATRIGETGADAADRTGPSLSPTSASFLREGEYWTIAFAGDAFRLRDAKGLRYLARLLVHAGRETLALELVRDGAGRPGPSGRPAREPELTVSDLGSVGALLDDAAKQAYRARVHELQQELNEAEAWNDPERAERTREEIDFIARELSRAVGLGGRDRTSGSAGERARISVTRAIRLSLARIAEHSPALGQHLDTTIRTGSYCSYRPDPRAPIDWQT